MSATTSFKYNKGDRKVKDLYADLLEVIEPYLSDFTGYDEKEQAFNIVLAVKELLLEFSIENERSKEEILKWQTAYSREYQINENKGYNKKEEQYRQTLQEIKAIAERAFAVCDDDCGNANKFKEIIALTKAEEEWTR